MKRYILSLLLSVLWLQFFGKTGDIELRERIYVQTDKQLYLAGEQIRMKLLTLDTEQISLVFSKVAYAELVGDSIARVQIKVALSDGIGEGRMLLPVDLPTGYYRLIAYTQYMRNEGPEIFFEKIIGVVNTFQSDYDPEAAKAAATARADLQSMRPFADSARADLQSVRPFTDNVSQAEPSTPMCNGDDTRSQDFSTFNFQLSTLKPVYSTREHGELLLFGLPETLHTLSVSIAGKEMIVTSGSRGFSTLAPNSPTQQNQSATPPPITDYYIPEYEGHIITGTLINNQTGKAEKGNDFIISALSFPGNSINFFTGDKNDTGEIRFVTSGNNETKEIATIVYNEGEKYRIDVRSPFVTNFIPKEMPVLYIDSACYDQLLDRSVALQASHYYLSDSLETPNKSESFIQMIPTNSYPLDEYTRFTTMREVFIEFITNARFRRRDGNRELSVVIRKGDNSYYGTNPLVFLDGAPISNHELIYNYDPLLVEYISIYNYLCILGGNTFEGIVELKTYRGLMQDIVFDKSTQIIPYEGPQIVEKFVAPDYSIANAHSSRIPDGRHTLLWNPNILTAGQSTLRLPFDTSDLTGEFQATVEGITQDGEFFSATTVFKVE